MVFEGLSSFEVFLIFFFGILFIATGITVAYVIMTRYRWPIKVTLMGKIGNNPGVGPIGKDRCRLIAFGDGGEQIYFLRKNKKYRVAYGKFISPKHIMWVIASDLYWYNSTFEDFDLKLRQVGVLPIHGDMRYAQAALRKGIDTRWRTKSFLEKWGVPVTMGLLIIAIVIMAGSQWFWLDKMKDNQEISKSTAEVNLKVTEEINSILTKLDNIQSGSGFTQVNPPQEDAS